jgi:DNA-binding NarL/FixJ family response regulator
MKRALVIDDHEPSRKNLVGVLAESGFQIVGAATNGAAGLQYVCDPVRDDSRFAGFFL